MIELELGPTLRAAGRHKGAFALVVMQLATSFTILASLVVVGLWFHSIGRMATGYDETELIGVEVHTPTAAGATAALPLATTSPAIAGVSWLWPPLRAEDAVPTLHAANGRLVRGWTAYADRTIVEVLGLRLLEGAVPVGVGVPGEPQPVILTADLREMLFPGGAPALGATIASDDAPTGRVVAVVDHTIFRDPFYSDAPAMAIRMAPPPIAGVASYVVRARPGQREAVTAALLSALGPGGSDRVVAVTPYATVAPRNRVILDGLGKFFVLIGITVSIIALIGALAVSSFVVAARRRDVGIRRAVGARRRDILRYFLVEASCMGALGIGLGLGMTAAILWTMQDIFQGLPIDARHLAAVAVFLWADAIGAALLPARRAARIPPSMASRDG